MNGELGRLRWRCRRGMKELDLLLTRYVEDEYRGADPVYQEAFRRLLECADPLIYDYVLGRVAPPDAALTFLIRRITVQGSSGP